jgi:c-di-GMP-binding flagellar brake protein YcgR
MTQRSPSNLEPVTEVNVFWRSDGEFAPSRVSELSRTGAFIKTSHPAAVATVLEVRLDAPDHEICAQAVVRRVVPGQGMAVEFESVAEGDRARLDALVHQIEMAHVEYASRAAAPAASAPHGRRSTQSSAPGRGSTSARNRPIDRRSRFRHKFTAPVQLTESGSVKTVQAQLLDLGKGGCYVKLENPFSLGTTLQVCITETGQSFQARANVVSAEPGKGMGLTFTEIDPDHLRVLDGWLATSMERRWLAANRRRSQRVMVNLPVHVKAKNSAGLEVSEETKTVSISAHGALLRLEMSVTKGQTIVLRNPSTNDALECSVDYLGNTQDGRREVGVSFVEPNRTLWQIAFPPADWSPQHPEAKG